MKGSGKPAELACCGHLAHVFELLGKRWTALLVDVLMQRPARFSELRRAVPGLSDRVMSERLRELIDAGIVERDVDAGPPVCSTYRLTPLGRRLAPGLDALRAWAAAGEQADGAGEHPPAEHAAIAVSARPLSLSSAPTADVGRS